MKYKYINTKYKYMKTKYKYINIIQIYKYKIINTKIQNYKIILFRRIFLLFLCHIFLDLKKNVLNKCNNV